LAVDGHNIQQVISHNDNSVLMAVHIPWCGFCKNVMAIFEKLSHMTSETPIVLAEYDISTSGLHLPDNTTTAPSGLPQVLLFTNTSIVTSYTANPTLKNLLDFLKRHITGFTYKLESDQVT